MVAFMARWLPALFLACCLVAQAGAGDTGQTTGGADLKGELEAGLKARLPNEFAFVAQVVSLVDNGQLPLDMVKSTFVWAVRKRPYAPFPYFERAMRLRAAELGITL